MQSERDIFKYFDGTKDRFADPLVIHRKMFIDSEVDLDELNTLRNYTGDNEEMAKDAKQAQADFCAFIAEVFDVPQFQESDESESGTVGLMENELDALARSFLDFCNEVKKKLDQQRKSLQPSDSQDSNECPENSATKPCSDSICCEGSSTDSDQKSSTTE